MLNDNPYDEEKIAKDKTDILWCLGRLDDLHQQRLISLSQGPILTERGRIKYNALVGQGYKVGRDITESVMKAQFPGIGFSDREALIRLVINPQFIEKSLR